MRHAIRILLAIVAFIASAPFLAFGIVNGYIIFIELTENGGMRGQALDVLWPWLAIIGVSLLLGC